MNMPLPVHITRDIDQLKAGWMFVGSTFQSGSPHCDECPHCKTELEHHPYGEGHATQAYSECTLGQYASDKPTGCPAYTEHLSQQEDE